MTPAERQARRRAKAQAAGLKQVNLWVPADRADELRQIAAQMVRDAEDAATTS